MGERHRRSSRGPQQRRFRGQSPGTLQALDWGGIGGGIGGQSGPRQLGVAAEGQRRCGRPGGGRRRRQRRGLAVGAGSRGAELQGIATVAGAVDLQIAHIQIAVLAGSAGQAIELLVEQLRRVLGELGQQLLGRGRGLPLLEHQPQRAGRTGHQGEGLVVALLAAQRQRLGPAELAVAIPRPKAGHHLGAGAVADPIGQHDALGIARHRPGSAAAGPQVVHHQRLQAAGALAARHHLALVPALGLGVPLAGEQQAVVGQKGVGRSVGVVDDLDIAGVRHGIPRLCR